MHVAVAHDTVDSLPLWRGGVPNQEHVPGQTVAEVVQALRRRGHHAVAVETGPDLVAQLTDVLRGPRGPRGVVLNLAYGIQGEARYSHLPGLLEMLGVPYTGSGPLTHALALDKWTTKALLRREGIPTPEAWLVHAGDAPPRVPFPVMVKPRWEALSFGLRLVHDRGELAEAVAHVHRAFGQAALVERFVAGGECNVSVLGDTTLAPVEVRFLHGPHIYTRHDKKEGDRIVRGTAAPSQLATAARDVARRACRVLGCRDVARVDMRLDKQWQVLEVNSMACLSEGSSLRLAMKAQGLSLGDLLDSMVQAAWARHRGTRGRPPRPRPVPVPPT